MLKNKRFKPALAPTLIVVLMTGVLVSLGVWQLHRAEQKLQLLQRYENAPRLPALAATGLESDLATHWREYRYRRVRLMGAYDAGHQILLENQISHGRVGVMVITPFILADSGAVVLVNRGWTAAAGAAREVIENGPAAAPRRVRGLLNHPPAVGMRLGSPDDSKQGWPKPMPYVDLEWMALQLGRPVLPWVVLLARDEADGYHRDWRPSVRMGPEKHKGYAVQWFSLAGALVFLFVAGSMKPENRGGCGQGKTRETK